ncbi:MAG: glucose-6-phosphate dehydrogenase assembly protein OpcA [Rubrobacter sp.]|jgi:glucose-6-phosphate dehydrogenase assembly protein OpcA|nr:glucose-6-phosphate dehydrogenase assembly protein OpcA [Rubrobacter sp.]
MADSLQHVERELGRLRMNDDGTLGLRASVLNLIVVVGEESAEGVARSIADLANRHPSRSIILVSDAEGEASLDVRLSAFCSLRGGAGDNVCSEQITVHAAGPTALHLESVAGPLLVPDLPTFVFYPEDVPDSADGVTRLADRVILDSSSSTGVPESFRRIARLVRDPAPPHAIDLQWTALTPWRALTRELFSSPERAAELPNIHEVEVMHTTGGEGRTMLFAGWLASSLGWRPKENRRPVSGFVFESHSGGEIIFRTSSSTDDADLSRITLRAGECSFVISRHKELTEAHISVERGGEEIARRAVRIGRFDMGAMLGEELKFKGRDPIYESSLEKVMEMMET